MWKRCLSKLIVEILTGLLEESEREVESGGATIVRIGDVVDIGVMVEEFGDAVDASGSLECRCLFAESVDVGVVHANEHFEALEVVVADGACGMAEVVSV